MDDMTDFENRMAEDARRIAGPPHPVDVSAVFASIPASRSPWGRIGSMFSATKFAVAGVIVALFGGIAFVALISERPDDTIPAAATSTPTDTPSPMAVRVDVPEAEFGITVPPGWTYRLPLETGDEPLAIVMDSPTEPDVPFTQSCHVLAPDPDEQRNVDELVAEDFAPAPGELVGIFGEAVVERADLSLPAGPAVRVDRSFDDAGVSIYYFTDGERVRRLECAAERIVDDHWLSIAETFEFLPRIDAATVAADSGSFIPTAELVATLTMEEVEPGVLRVVDDGIDDGRGIERPPGSFPELFVDVTPAGQVWLSGGGGGGDLFRLGAPGAFEDAAAGPLEVGPDGTLWALDDVVVRRFDSGVWTSWQLEDGLETRALTIDGEGVPWVLAEEDTIGDERLLTLTPGGTWEQIEVPWDLSGAPDWRWLESAPDGSLWLSGGQVRDPDGPWSPAMLHFDGVGWEVIDVPWESGDAHGLGVGPDGVVWREFVDPEARLDIDPDEAAEDLSGDWIGLARLDDDGWSTFGAADGVGSLGQRVGIFFGADLLEVAPDGTVWVNAAMHYWDCGGVASFDGVDWEPYLEGRCIHDLAVAPDGAAWVRADLDGSTPLGPTAIVGTFVILPGD